MSKRYLHLILLALAYSLLGFKQAWTQGHGLGSGPGTGFSSGRNLDFNEEQQALEAARYLYKIEGNIKDAKLRLDNLLTRSQNEEIKTEASFLLGRILEFEGKADSATVKFQVALNGKGLPANEKLWLYHRLLAKNPNSVQPIILSTVTTNGPNKIFRDKVDQGTLYTLEFRNLLEKKVERTKELFLQNEEGDLVRSRLPLSINETILDADATQYLVYNQASRKIFLRPLFSGKSWEISVPEKVDLGAIFKVSAGSFLFLGSGQLNYYQQGQLTWKVPVEQEGCNWISNPDQNEIGVLQCLDNQIFLINVKKKKFQPIAGIRDKVLQVSWEEGYLAIRYIDRFEIRTGPGFEIVKWGLASQLQDKLILGNEHVYLVSPKGLVKSYPLESGQLEWQKDILANQLIAYDGSIFASTFAQTIVNLDMHGKLNWTYEYGWDQEPILLPNEKWLVLQYEDGRRIKLNRELLRITANSNSFKFANFQAKEGEKDLKGSLNALEKVLSLEPGNGEAWKKRSEQLKLTGAPRQEMNTALIEGARSLVTPNWSTGPLLKNLSASLGANWIWKRQFGPKFYPNLNPHKENSFYLENDNQTLVILNHETGSLVNSFHFSEELDMKVSLWKNDTICVSGPSRLYFLAPTQSSTGLSQFPLKNPVCQAQAVNNGIVYSDWYGGLYMLGLPDRTLRWERKLGQSGLLVGKAKPIEYLDILDLEGKYFALQPASGKVLWNLRLPPGTITEAFSNKDYIYAAYNHGAIICIDRAKQSLSWIVDFGEQIFSLSGNRENTLVLTTASKKLICVQANTGTIISQVYIQSYLFNRPTVFDHGYWLGTTEPALEKRNFNHELILKYKLPDLPGSPVMYGNSIFIGTLDNFILSFPF